MKEKLLKLLSYILVAALATVITTAITVDWDGPSKLDQLEDLIATHFIGETNITALEDAAADAMVTATGDRWSYYIPASEYQSYTEQMANAYVGVGITIQVQEDPAGFLVLIVTEGSPAEEAGLKVNDLLIQVEDQDVREMPVEDVRNLVRGKEDTFVSMTVQRGEETITLSVERRTVKTPVASHTMLENSVGLVTIENFDTRCAEETIGSIEALLEQGAQKLIFDVRNNPGGYAAELVKVLDYLLPEGEVFRTVNYKGEENVDMSDENCLDIPMAVLVNSGSYSAAEFFAAALRDYDAAQIVGEKTTGKGYFQSTYRLNDGSAVALSIGKYFTPKGENLAGTGLTPDYEVAVDDETAAAIYYGTLSPEEDPQIQKARDILG